MRGEEGTGMVASVVGVTAFLVLLMFAVQLALNLYATSTVTAVAFDGARIVAGADGGPDAEAEAEAHIRSILDGQDVRLLWDDGGDVVALTIETENPTRLLRLLPIPFQHVTRTVTVRKESFR